MELVRDTGSVVPEESAQADVSYLVGDVQGKSRGRTGALQQQHPSGTSVSSYNAMMRPEASGLRLLYATLDDMAHSEYSRISRIPQRLWYPAGSSSAKSFTMGHTSRERLLGIWSIFYTFMSYTWAISAPVSRSVLTVYTK